MHLTFTVAVDVERVEGKFASRDDIGAQIQEALDGANPGEVYSENEALYEVAEWDVQMEDA